MVCNGLGGGGGRVQIIFFPSFMINLNLDERGGGSRSLHTMINYLGRPFPVDIISFRAQTIEGAKTFLISQL